MIEIDRREAMLGVAVVVAEAIRAIPLDELREVASEPATPAWIVALVGLATEIETEAPPAPERTPLEQLCSACVSSVQTANGLCAVCNVSAYVASDALEVADMRTEIYDAEEGVP